ncbi:helix-turn-helix transcriptional regulator [Gluconobacter sp. LMG 1744]|uniref:HTH cro/C1-type domain-containing protein n=2 Tax=Gluconobacter kondonii TaxID=941463 RepID=A0ABQ5WUE5_9PROT|nr:helix-turn-helix transcriptional regulator [Gluconobacter cadivus]GBR34995.1 hypothetical protein AA3266_2004 [Gluconobacter kondonii NBRC 3266]GLQ67182.1 hypothetical protein GCM10007870_27670 [Gluconobacter kondonii]
MPKMNLSLQSHLRAWRKQVGLSQEQLGNKMDVAHTTVGRWERGEVPLTSDQFEHLARIFEVSPAELLVAPPDAASVRVLHETYEIVRNMSPETLRHWLEIGKKLSS